jgi:hypothetical protein
MSLLRARRERPSYRRGRKAEQPDELAPSWVEHGLPRKIFREPAEPAYRTVMLLRKRPAGPWGGPELFWFR